jgi:hypothetical protein
VCSSDLSDYVSRKQVNEILYNDLEKEERSQVDKTFSRKDGQWYIATSSENPSRQIPYRYKRGKFKKRRASPEGIRLCKILYGQEVFPDGRKIENVDEQVETFRSISVSVKRNYGSKQEQNSGDEKTSGKEMLFGISRNSPSSENIRITNVGLDKEWSIERNSL